MKLKRALHSLKRSIHPKRIRTKFLHYALKGNNVQCPCCSSSYLLFLPAGLQKRPNALCMNCGSLERHRALWIYLKEQGEIFNSQVKLLHVAPEKLYYKKFSSHKNISYYPIDLNPENYNYGRKTIKMDVTRLNFPDEFFDAIICNHVLEHVVEDTKAIKEIYRVLKPGRWAILNVPIDLAREKTFEDAAVTDPVKRMELFHQPDHVRIYGKDYITRLTNAGFQVETIDYGSRFLAVEQFKYGIKASELIFFCRKMQD